MPENFKAPLLEGQNLIDLYSNYRITLKNKYKLPKAFIFCLLNRISCIVLSPGPYSIRKERYFNLPTIRYYLLHSIGIKTLHIGKCCSNYIYNDFEFNNPLADIMYLRSEQSVNHAKKTIKKIPVKYIPDICFLLRKRINPSKKNKSIIIDVRAIDNNNSLFNQCKYISKHMLDKEYKVILYYQVESDYVNVKKLYDYIDDSRIEIREEIVWYNNMSFYEDKQIVISNRLHSLLIGAAYGAYPLCLFENTPLTAKLKHVISSSFRDLPILLDNNQNPDIEELCRKNLDRMECKFLSNSNQCQSIIKNIVDSIVC